jgi:hypothetical protein
MSSLRIEVAERSQSPDTDTYVNLHNSTDRTLYNAIVTAQHAIVSRYNAIATPTMLLSWLDIQLSRLNIQL